MMIDALYSDITPSPSTKRRQKEISTSAISRYIETLSLMDVLVMNGQITPKAQERSPDVKVSTTTICDTRVTVGFQFRPREIRPDLLPN
jgi:hypothetical protein